VILALVAESRAVWIGVDAQSPAAYHCIGYRERLQDGKGIFVVLQLFFGIGQLVPVEAQHHPADGETKQ